MLEHMHTMITKFQKWKASEEDIEFLAKLNEDLNSLDFYYEFSSSSKRFDNGSNDKQSILSKIREVSDKNLQEAATILYDLHVAKNDGKLAVKWEWVLED